MLTKFPFWSRRPCYRCGWSLLSIYEIPTVKEAGVYIIKIYVYNSPVGNIQCHLNWNCFHCRSQEIDWVHKLDLVSNSLFFLFYLFWFMFGVIFMIYYASTCLMSFLMSSVYCVSIPLTMLSITICMYWWLNQYGLVTLCDQNSTTQSNGLVKNEQKAVAWTSEYTIHWRPYVSPYLNELMWNGNSPIVHQLNPCM